MGFVKKVLWAGITIAIIYFGYLAYINWWNAGGTLEQRKQAAEQYVSEKKAEVGKQVSDKASAIAGGVVTSAKQGVLDYVKGKISDGLTVVGESLVHSAESLVGATTTALATPVTVHSITGSDASVIAPPTNVGFMVPAVPATIATRVGSPLIFSVNRGLTYSVRWGDGATDSGRVDTESVKLLSHTWSVEGDYTVAISIRGGGVSQDTTFPVRIYP